MASVQLNVRTSPTIMDEIDIIVDKGYFRSRSEAVNEALRFMIRRYRVLKITENIRKKSKKHLTKKDLTKALLEARAEEDE